MIVGGASVRPSPFTVPEGIVMQKPLTSFTVFAAGLLIALLTPSRGHAQFFSFRPTTFGTFPLTNFGYYPSYGYGTGLGYYSSPTYYYVPPTYTTWTSSSPSYGAPALPYAARDDRYRGYGYARDVLPERPRMRESLYPAIPLRQMSDEGGRARLEFRVPTADAQLWLNDRLTQQAGTDRVFTTPPLALGGPYAFDVRVQWTDAAGRPQTKAYQVEVRPGDSKVINVGG